jgi:Lipoprotein signal peptidase
MRVSKKAFWAIAVILLILVADQCLKIWVKNHMYLYQEFEILPWFIIRFVENPGMAMGIDVFNKLFLSIFRIVASIAIIYYFYTLIKRNFSLGYLIVVAMIFAGAVGNIVDSVFYGVIFSESTPMTMAVLFPTEGGYGTWLHGKVVDMFYFPLFSFEWPSWMPFVGGETFEFFRYIFNLADASISVGMTILILFYRKSFSLSFEKQEIEA